MRFTVKSLQRLTFRNGGSTIVDWPHPITCCNARTIMEEGEEERATAVPNREGKAKSRWTVASLPRFTKGRPGLHVGSEVLLLLAVVSLICWNGTTCQRNMVCNFSCKMRSGRVGLKCRISFFLKVCRISYRPLFF